jgi:[ribosomal protein S18]-alanine N-acetyltransferase
VIVRLATPADIPAMLVLEKDADAAAHWSRAQYEQIFLRAGDPSRLTLVIGEDAALRGFLVARQIDDEFEIENIAVAGSVRQRGLGTRLVGELVAVASHQGGKAVFLEVRESNRAARALYEKCGFREIGHRKRYYQSPEEAAVLYRLDLARFAT